MCLTTIYNSTNVLSTALCSFMKLNIFASMLCLKKI